MKKTITTLALASLYSTQLLATVAVEPAVEGQISTLGELRWLADNYGAWTKDWVLTNDIDATDTKNWNTGEGFVPIGNLYGYGFRSAFDAQGHTISNLYISRPSEDKVGLFGFLYGGSVKNLTLLNPVVVGKDYVGSLVGSATGATMEDVTVTSPKVTGASVVGGVAGADSNTTAHRINVTDVDVTGSLQTGGYAGKGDYTDMDGVSLTGRVTSDGNETGGMWGRTTFSKNDRYGTGIKNVVFSGEVHSSGDYTGGVAGYTTGSNYINGLESDVLVVSTGSYTGLGFGEADQVELLNMTLKGEVYGVYYVGGLAGRFENNERYSWMQHENIIIDGLIEGGDYVGGIAGHSGSITGESHTITSNTTVKGVNNVGGFYGEVIDGARGGRNNFFFGQVEGEQSVGGFYGLVGGDAASYGDFDIRDSGFVGTIKGVANVGGFAGKVYSGNPVEVTLTMADSYIKGTITATSDVAGITPYIGANALYFSDAYVDITFNTPKGVAEAATVIDSALPTVDGWGFRLIYNKDKSSHNQDHFYAKGVSSEEMAEQGTFHNYEFSNAWSQDKWQLIESVGSPTRVLAPIPLFSAPNETEGGIPEQSMEIGESYTFNVSAHEQGSMDSSIVTYSLEASAPEFVSIDANGLLTVAPALESHEGAHEVVVVANIRGTSNKLPVMKVTVAAKPEPEPKPDNAGGDNSGDNGGSDGDVTPDKPSKSNSSGGSLGSFTLIGVMILGLRRKFLTE